MALPLEMEAPPQQQQHTDSKPLSIAFLISLAILWAFVVFVDGKNGILFPLVFIPSIAFLVWWARNKHLISFHSVTYAYGYAFYCGSIYVLFYKVIVFLIIVSVIRPSFQQDSFSMYLTLALYSWCGFAVGSEFMKYRIASQGRKERPDLVNVKAYLLYSTAGALGFVTFSLILEIFVLGYRNGSVANILLSLLLRAWIDVPIQTASGYLIGIGVAKNEIYKWNISAFRILLLPVIVVGLSEMVFLVAVLIYGWYVDIIIITVAYLIILAVLLPYIYFQSRELPSSFALLNADEDGNVTPPSPDRLDLEDDMPTPSNGL